MDVFQRNLRFLAAHVPGLAQLVQAAPETMSLVRLSNGDLDIQMGDRLFYGSGAMAAALRQVGAFSEDGDIERSRLTVDLPYPCHDRVTHDFVAAVLADLERAKQRPEDRRQDGRAAKVVALGLGLGFHLLPLVEATQCRSLVVVEPHSEFLRLSLQSFDWEALFAILNARGCQVSLVFAEDDGEIPQQIQGVLRAVLPPLSDGTIFFMHYNAPRLLAIADKVISDRHLLSINFGFLADELQMVRNTWRNVRQRNARQYREMPRSTDLPAIVVGSGPSFDRALPALCDNHGRALVISCGTALGLLLRNGIQPDIHCELENVEAPAELIAGYGEQYDLSRILLVASTTVDHNLTSMFDRSVLFFRIGLSTELLFHAGTDEVLENVTPLVSNLGMVVARATGAREVYFIGIDLGTKDLDRHHSAQSPYMNGTWTFTCPLPITVPGNFSGEVHTEPEYLMSRHTKEVEIRANGRGRRYHNCSDGVRIDGAPPLQPEAISLPPATATKEQVVDSFFAAMRPPTAEALDLPKLADDTGGECRRLAEALAGVDGYEAAREALVRFAYAVRVDGGAARVVSGSAVMMAMAAHHLLARAPAERRDAFACLVIDGLRSHVLAMEAKARAYFEALAAEGGPRNGG